MSKPCLFNLYPYCIVYSNTPEDRRKDLERIWGSPDFIKLYCAMCVKTLYASRFKARDVYKYSVVNTL